MEKKNKTNSYPNNQINIEKQIVSMLENVLKEDSDYSSEETETAFKKNSQVNNKLNLQYNKKEKKISGEEKVDFIQGELKIPLNTLDQLPNNFNNHQKLMTKPQIFINSIPVFKENEQIDCREYFIGVNQNNHSPNNSQRQMPTFNNLSPISKQLKNQSPRGVNEENVNMFAKQPQKNRLHVSHIGMNMGFQNQQVQHVQQQNNSGKNVKNHMFVRNNTINHSMNKLCLNNKIVDNNSSTGTTNSNVSNLNYSNDQIKTRLQDKEGSNLNFLVGSYNSNENTKQTKSEIDEFIENKMKLDDKIEPETFDFLKGRFFRIVTSQNGSRTMQNYIFKSSLEVIKKIFTEISIYMNDIITNVYGNYFCQKFFCVLDIEDRKIFLNKIMENILENSKSKVGTYPLQAIIENIKTEEEKKILFESLNDKIMEMSLDAQAAHVIEKILNNFPDDEIEFMYDDILENFMLLANHMKGLCVVKKAIQQVKSKDILEKFKNIITDNALALVHNPYGNYAIQTVFESWPDETFLPLLNKFIGKFYVLSMQKYSSNVVEKCLEKGNQFMISKFVDEICNFTRALDLMKSSYGNYVMQKALKVSTGESKEKLTDTIINNIDKLNDKKLVFKWKQISSEATGKNLTFPCENKNFGNFSHNISPNTSFNSANSNVSNNSRNSANPCKTSNKNNLIFNNQIQNNINNNHTCNKNLYNSNSLNQNFNPNVNLNLINSNNQYNPNNTNMNFMFMPKNFSKSYNNSPVNMRMDQMINNFSNFNNNGINNQQFNNNFNTNNNYNNTYNFINNIENFNYNDD